MPAGDYIEGLALFGAMLGGTLGGAAVIMTRRLPGLRGSTRVLAFALIATLGVLAVHLAPAILGVLGRGSVIVASAIWLLAALALPRVASPGEEEPDEREPSLGAELDAAFGSARALWALVGLSVGIVVALLLAVLSDNLTLAPQSNDLLNFHLPGVARWIETGSIWQIDVFLPDVAPGNYPNNGDVILLAAVLPWHNDFLAHLAMYPYWALTGLALYALARELGAARPASILAACVVSTIPAVAVPALLSGLVDALALFGLATGILFLLRHRRTGAAADLVLAGLALGVAFGTKWYAVSTVAIIVAVWVVGVLVERRQVRRVLTDLGAVVGLVALAGGIWMLRNLIESQNPVFPVEFAPFGLTIFDAPPDIVRETAGFTLLDYVGDWSVWSEFILPQLRHTLAGPAILIGIGFACAVVLIAARGRAAPRRGTLIAGAVCAVALLVAYAITPYSAGGQEGSPLLVAADARYAVPALLAGAAVAVGASTLGPRVAIGFALLTPIALFDGARWTLGAYNEAAGLNPATWGVTIVAVVAIFALWPWIADRLLPELAGRGRSLALGAAVVAAVVLGAGGYEIAKRFNDDRYLGADAVVDAVIEGSPSGASVGLAGVWPNEGISPVLPAFGPRFENEVSYVGEPDEGFLRRYGTEPEFAAALERGGYDLLIVGKGRFEAPEVPEQQWALDAGYVPLTESGRLRLLVREDLVAPNAGEATTAP